MVWTRSGSRRVDAAETSAPPGQAAVDGDLASASRECRSASNAGAQSGSDRPFDALAKERTEHSGSPFERLLLDPSNAAVRRSLGALAGDPDGSRGVDNGAPPGEAEVRLKTPIRLLGLRAAGPQQAARSVEANHDPA